MRILKNCLSFLLLIFFFLTKGISTDKDSCESQFTTIIENYLTKQADVILKKSNDFDHIRELHKFLTQTKYLIEKLEKIYYVTSGEPRNERESHAFDQYRAKIADWRESNNRENLLLQMLDFFSKPEEELPQPESIGRYIFKNRNSEPEDIEKIKIRSLTQLFGNQIIHKGLHSQGVSNYASPFSAEKKNTDIFHT